MDGACTTSQRMLGAEAPASPASWSSLIFGHLSPEGRHWLLPPILPTRPRNRPTGRTGSRALAPGARGLGRAAGASVLSHSSCSRGLGARPRPVSPEFPGLPELLRPPPPRQALPRFRGVSEGQSQLPHRLSPSPGCHPARRAAGPACLPQRAACRAARTRHALQRSLILEGSHCVCAPGHSSQRPPGRGSSRKATRESKGSLRSQGWRPPAPAQHRARQPAPTAVPGRVAVQAGPPSPRRPSTAQEPTRASPKDTTVQMTSGKCHRGLLLGNC